MRHQPATEQAATTLIPDDAQPYLRWADNPNMTCRQAAILALVLANPGATVGALALVMGVPKPSVTRAADKLEEMGLLFRTPSAGDRRLVQMHATKAAPARLGQAPRGGE